MALIYVATENNTNPKLFNASKIGAAAAKAEAKMQKVAESAPTYDHLQTNANLLAKIGDKKETIKQAELAITKAKESGEDFKELEELIKKNQ